MNTIENDPTYTNLSLLDAFRWHYFRLDATIAEVMNCATDTTVLARIGDDLCEYSSLLNEHSGVFEAAELQQLQTNLSLMVTDVRVRYTQALDESHQGHPVVVVVNQNGRRGRPQIMFDPQFLAWAYNRRSISSLARFLRVGRTTLRNALIEHGIMPQQRQVTSPSLLQQESDAQELLPDEVDDILEPNLNIPDTLPEDISNISEQIPINISPSNPSNRHSDISDQDLDELIVRLRVHYRRAGIGMLDGMLRRLGHQVQRERIRMSLLRIDPVRRVFERIRIRRRTYSVAGPNALWHHDGQHGLIRWGIVIHGFIDGYSRLITGLQASSNNYGDTVLDVFLHGAAEFGVPSRLRGDHGTENILIAAWMEERNGRSRGSYIWGRSIHNVRIERLWVDVTAQVGATWATLFTMLELRHGLDINNAKHVWLLQFLFLPTINQDLTFFAEAWNEHKIQIKDGPNRSPIDMFNFDMLVHGVRGSDLAETMSAEELEVYGIDWEGLRDDRILHSQSLNNSTEEGDTSWLGHSGPPIHLSDVWVHTPDMPFDEDVCWQLHQALGSWLGRADDNSVLLAWTHGLAYARQIDAAF